MEAFGFVVVYERIEETFAYLSLKGVDFMVRQTSGVGRQWLTGELDKPFGRGVNFQIEVENVDLIYTRGLRCSSASIYLNLEDKDYLCGSKTTTNRQFIVQDPDVYLLRFAQLCNSTPRPVEVWSVNCISV